jgi:DNA-binding SARP family transcriptional activator/Tol biopolymer transport system component
MARLTLSLLGPFQASLDGQPVAGFESDKARALLAYLALESDRPHRRAKLAGLLWPERSDRDALNNLRHALANLRRVIRDQDADPPFLRVSRQAIRFDRSSDASVDAATFNALIDQPAPSAADLEEAVALYRGDLLEGFFVGDSVRFEEWVLLKRQQLRRKLLAALHRLAATHEAKGEYGRALPYAYRQVELEPWQEKAQRQLMRLLALDGQRAAALAQYQSCRHALADALGVEPARDTSALYEQILDEQPLLASAVPPAAPGPAGIQPPRAARWGGLGRKVGTLPGLALLAVVAAAVAIAILALGSGWSGEASPEIPPTYSLPTPPHGKIIHVCEGTAPSQICVYDSLTDEVTQLTDDLTFYTIGRVSWSPEAERIVFDAAVGTPSSADARHGLYVMDADGSDMTPLTAGDKCDAHAVWSPDGELIAFNREGDLWAIRPDGSGAERLVGGSQGPSVGDLAWSPDGESIAFVGRRSPLAGQPQALWVVSREGAAPEELYLLPQGFDSVELLWSDDGEALLCNHAYEGGERMLLLFEMGRHGETSTVDRLPYWWRPTFSPQWGGHD